MKIAVVRAFGLFASVVVAGVASAQSSQSFEWKASEGGNGHWYRFVSDLSITWSASASQANAQGAYLADLESQFEANWLISYLATIPGGLINANRDGPFLGGFQASGAAEPSGGWGWTSGRVWLPALWSGGEPNNDACGWPENYAHLVNSNGVGQLNDITNVGYGGCPGRVPSGYLLEWSADCNRDGIVDYGQILRGELEDLNGNGIPDSCETSISSVLPPSVPAQGGSTLTIRGSGFPANPIVRVAGVPATNVVRESATRITATSPAVLPGMASVSVNDFTLADGIYIRPECGSDLDQNGVVDGGDMSILLMDWGQCYATVASPEAGDSTPFMLQEEPAVAAPQSR